MPTGWLDAVTDATIWGRVTGEDMTGPVPLVGVDGRPSGFARAGHTDPEGRPWRFAVPHHLAEGQSVAAAQARNRSSSAARASGASSAMWWPEGKGRPRRSSAQGRQTARTSP
jgi:hypothetical protein